MDPTTAHALSEVARIQRQHRTSTVTYKLYSGDWQAAIDARLAELASNGSGEFTREKNRSISYRQYLCCRNRAPAGASTGFPTKTRANNCNANVIFRRFDKFYVECLQSEHKNHDLLNPSHAHVSSIDYMLYSLIITWLQYGRSVCEVVCDVMKWCSVNGHNDINDRRFYPSLEDIRNMKRKIKRERQMDNIDSVSVDKLLQSTLKEFAVFYQRYHVNEQPLIIVLQSEWQKKQLCAFGNMVFVDATYKGITAYGYAFYCVVVRSTEGRGIPAAFIIVSDDTQETLECGFEKLKDANPHWFPR